MEKKPIRYDPKHTPYTKAMIEDDLGNYVNYEDYQALETENAKQVKLLESIKSTLENGDMMGSESFYVNQINQSLLNYE